MATAADIEQVRRLLAPKYQLVRELGRGGMAIVYLVRNVGLERMEALKMLLPPLNEDGMAVARFEREARTAAKLDHDNIVRIYDVCPHGPLTYFTMMYLEGETLADRLKPGPQDTAEVLRVALGVCAALGCAHAGEVVHRDIKPANIMLCTDGRVVVMDFGIARPVEDTQALTCAGALLATPQYMSPEQASGGKLDHRSDIYSLGVVLYHMATGRLPFVAPDLVALLAMHAHARPAAPRAHNPDVPQWLENAILKCLAKEPTRRHDSAADLAAVLRAGGDSQGTSTGSPETEDVHGWFPPQPRDPEPRRPVRPRRLLVPVALILLGVLGWGAWSWQVDRDRAAARRARAAEGLQAGLSARSRADYAEAVRHFEDVVRKDPTNAEAVRLLREAEVDAQAKQTEDSTRAAREAEDDAAFRHARVVGTEASFAAYIRAQPSGRHMAEARAALQLLSAKRQQAEQAEKRRAALRRAKVRSAAPKQWKSSNQDPPSPR